MIKKIKDYTNEELIETFLNFWDENDAIEALSELRTRKHPRTEEFCKIVFERDEFDEFDKGVGISIYYLNNDINALEYAIKNFKEWHIITLGYLISELWQDSEQENSDEKKELIRIIKNHLKTLKKSEIREIQEDYDAFMKAYKNV